jgi:hypothetical protein
MSSASMPFTRRFVLVVGLVQWSGFEFCGQVSDSILSRRDWMIVARQFTAWDAQEKDPSRRERYD